MSGGVSPVTGKYTGNGVDTTKVYIPCGFVPKRIKIMSVEGVVTWFEGMPGAFSEVDGANPVNLGATELQTETKDGSGNPFLGFSILSDGDTVNKNAVDYYWEAY